MKIMLRSFVVALLRVGCVASLLWLAACATGGGGTSQNDADNNSTVDINQRTEQSPERARASIRLELAINYYREGRFSVALDELRQVIQIDPKFADAHGVLALVYMDLGERTLAEASFIKALQLSPNNSDINNNYGWFLCQTGRESQSFPYFMTAVKNPLYPTPDRPMQNAGVCALRMGDFQNAEAYLSRAFEFNPGNLIALFNLANVYYRKNEIERARFYVSRFNREIDPTAESLWLALRIERKMGDRVAENALATQLRRRYPNSPEYEKFQRGAFDE